MIKENEMLAKYIDELEWHSCITVDIGASFFMKSLAEFLKR